MSVHPAIAEHPRWQEYEAHIARLDVAESTIRVDLSAAVAEHEEAFAAWSEEAAAARAELRPEPPRPEPPDTTAMQDALLRLSLERRDHFGQERLDVLTAIAPEVESAYEAARPDLSRRTARKIRALDREVEEWAAWLTALRSVRRATERHDPNRQVVNGGSTRMPVALGLDDLLVVAEDVNTDPCRPTALALPEGGVRRADGDDDEPLRLQIARPRQPAMVRRGGR